MLRVRRVRLSLSVTPCASVRIRRVRLSLSVTKDVIGLTRGMVHFFLAYRCVSRSDPSRPRRAAWSVVKREGA